MSISLDTMPAPVRSYFTAMNAFDSVGMAGSSPATASLTTSSASSGDLKRSSGGLTVRASPTRSSGPPSPAPRPTTATTSSPPKLTASTTRPGALMDDAPAGRVPLGTALPLGQIPRADVATLVLEVPEQSASAGHAWGATSGPRR